MTKNGHFFDQKWGLSFDPQARLFGPIHHFFKKFRVFSLNFSKFHNFSRKIKKFLENIEKIQVFSMKIDNIGWIALWGPWKHCSKPQKTPKKHSKNTNFTIFQKTRILNIFVARLNSGEKPLMRMVRMTVLAIFIKFHRNFSEKSDQKWTFFDTFRRFQEKGESKSSSKIQLFNTVSKPLKNRKKQHFSTFWQIWTILTMFERGQKCILSVFEVSEGDK
jgi:hypothetical protein